MRSTTIAMIIVVALSMALCTLSLLSVRRAVGEMDILRVRAGEQARAGDLIAAEESLVAIANRLQKARATLEILTSHDDLHEVMLQIADARVCLEFEEMSEFQRTLALMGETLSHIRDMEEPTLANLY